MKILIAFFILTTVYREVSSFTFLEFVGEKLIDFANTVTVAINNVKNKVKQYIFHKIAFDFASNIETSNKNEHYDEVSLKERQSKKFDPTIVLSPPQLAIMHGKSLESHVVRSKDGYLLTLHRFLSSATIRHHRNTFNNTVLLHHGLLGSSADWILLGPEKSLPYLLSQAGYDVWIANARGNYYSRGHVSLKVNSMQFWKFTWQEMGQFDLPAYIEYIRKFKKMDEPINYVGHSMGCTALLVLLSVMPEYNKYLRIGILLAPLAFMRNAEGPLKILGTMASNPPEQILQLMGKGEFLPLRQIPKWVAIKYCKGPIIYCSNPLFFLSGGTVQYNTWNATFVERVLYHTPAGTSSDTLLHYAQLIETGKFHRYCEIDSEFPLRRVTLPIALFSSTDDTLATVPDVLKLYFSIANPIDNYVIRGKHMSHTDFVWGPEADSVVFIKVIDYLNNFSSWNFIKTNKIENNAKPLL